MSMPAASACFSAAAPDSGRAESALVLERTLEEPARAKAATASVITQVAAMAKMKRRPDLRSHRCRMSISPLRLSGEEGECPPLHRNPVPKQEIARLPQPREVSAERSSHRS